MPSLDDGGGAEDFAPVPRSRTMAYRRAGQRPPVSEQVAGLQHDLACHRFLAEQGDPRARGAALAVGFAALRLAVTAAGTDEDVLRRDQALQQAFPVLTRVGLGHVADLIAAALACEADPARLVVGARGLQ